MDELQVKERRTHQRYRANPCVAVTIRGGEGKWSRGVALNISRSGAYLLAESMIFVEGTATFELPGGAEIQVGCRLIDGCREGGETMGLAVTRALTEEEISLLKAEGYED